MKQSIKKTNRSTKILEIYAECRIRRFISNKIFYIQDLFQPIFLTSIQPQITQELIKSHQRMNWLVFLSF